MTDKETKSLNIHQRLFNAQGELEAIEKTKPTAKGFYEFTSHDDVTKASKEVFLKHGILCIDDVIDADFKPIDIKKWDNYAKQEKEVTEILCTIKMQVHLINKDNPEDMIIKHSYGQGIDNSDKAYGKAVSYAFKYALLKGLMAKTGLDSDAEQTITIQQNQQQAPKETATAKKAKYEKFLDNIKQVDMKNEKQVEWLKDNIQSWIDWTNQNYNFDYANQLQDAYDDKIAGV